MGVAAWISGARKLADLIYTDWIEVERLIGRVDKPNGDVENVYELVYTGKGLVQYASNTRSPIEEQVRGGVNRVNVKVPVGTIPFRANDRVTVKKSLDIRLVEQQVILADDLAQGLAITNRYYGNFIVAVGRI